MDTSSTSPRKHATALPTIPRKRALSAVCGHWIVDQICDDLFDEFTEPDDSFVLPLSEREKEGLQVAVIDYLHNIGKLNFRMET